MHQIKITNHMKAKLKKKLLLTFSHEDYAKVKTAAKDAGLPVSTYIRVVTLKNLRHV